ncbi:PQQ-dependent sugar dehydrogenase [Roseivivax sp. GX 12232]|uniref:PQQ-dependent sugar dehydrogenase n=1 Tax=Roseivivax sp. GX 12232 TaxID=2900547 RepID=UPI001E2B8413|nr:PQQ-dependent sugar dehydrogenase [Roseivivax sp. GX 12232]MCE0504826.1 PQQ-dependent sugar dehydrogenase [Roseivivax sp. GX 12232]
MTQTPLRALGLSALALTLAAPAFGQGFERGPRNTDFPPAREDQFRAPLVQSEVTLATETLAEGLTHPWGIAVLPEGAGYLVSERPGALRFVDPEGAISEPIGNVPKVRAQGQGGLLDVALAPDFAESRRVYLTYAKPIGLRKNATAAAYGRLSDDLSRLEDVTEFFVQEPSSFSPAHFGSRVVFDGAGHVFVTTGEHSTEEERVFAQDLDKTYGKIVRFTEDGAVPEDNPFVDDPEAVPSIWSYGHRNVQGAHVRDGQLWTIEHGPRGGDELNLPEPGKNYGWPVISYGETYGGSPIGSGEAQAEGMEQPVYFWDPVIAPGDLTIYEGDLFPEWQGDMFIGSLNPGGIVRLGLEGDRVGEEERMLMQLGRVRDVTVDADGSLLAITDADNGRIVRITPQGSS